VYSLNQPNRGLGISTYQGDTIKDFANNDGNTILHLAVQQVPQIKCGDISCYLPKLVSCRNALMQNKEGQTPLLIAAQSIHRQDMFYLKLFDVILSPKAKIITDCNGRLPLHIAVLNTQYSYNKCNQM